MKTKQFHIFHSGDNLSSDQLVLIEEEVNKRRHILKLAMENLSRVMDSIEPPREPARKTKRQPQVNKTPPKHLVKRSDTSEVPAPDQKVLKGRVSYKVKGPDGRPMNIAEIKAKINSIYDGKQGIIKQ